MNNLMKFENNDVEVFEFNGKVLFNPYHVGKCLELADSTVRRAIQGMNKNQVVKLTKSIVHNVNNLVIPTAGKNFLTESGVYKLIFKSRKKEAEKFCDWVTDEVLPSIRKTGKYENKNNIQEPYKLQRKAYCGNPVMTVNDLSYLLGMSRYRITFYSGKYNISRRVIEGEELEKFKRENKNVDIKACGSLALYYEGDVYLFYSNLGMKTPKDVEEYFCLDIPECGLSDYDRLRLLQLAEDLRTLQVTKSRRTRFYDVIGDVILNIYNDMNLLDKKVTTFDINYLDGDRLFHKVQQFKKNILVKLQ